ncbi:MAG: serine/threonine-protein phosphatase, partial [Gammaproteobacteria bacterium]|nr:serine/threonine-protein phosphatase [Gammaproteobacteria bacterium]
VLRGKVRDGDLFLLCSDGLTDMVTDDDIERICNTGLPIQARVQQLIDLAKENGGKDNVTVVLCEVNVDSVGQLFSSVKNKLLGK